MQPTTTTTTTTGTTSSLTTIPARRQTIQEEEEQQQQQQLVHSISTTEWHHRDTTADVNVNNGIDTDIDASSVPCTVHDVEQAEHRHTVIQFTNSSTIPSASSSSSSSDPDPSLDVNTNPNTNTNTITSTSTTTAKRRRTQTVNQQGQQAQPSDDGHNEHGDDNDDDTEGVEENDDQDDDDDEDEDDEDEDEDEDALECRICRESDGLLVSPCLCKTVVHLECLQRWVGYRSDALFPLLSSSVGNTCEICRHPLDYSKFSSSSTSSRSSRSSRTNTSTTSRTSTVSPNTHSSTQASHTAFAQSPSYYRPSSRFNIWLQQLCNVAFTVETCLFVFLFVLAVMGHALFVMGVFKRPETSRADDDEHSHKRVALALANAIVTFALLVCVQKIVVRWLREADYRLSTMQQPSTSTVIVDDSHQHPQQLQGSTSITVNPFHHHQQSSSTSYASRCTTVSQIFLGALLSVVAAAEIFLIIRELPLGGLA